MHKMRLWPIRAVALALFIVLGFLVATPPFSRLDAAATALQGHGMQAAVIFTESGRCLPLLSIGLIGIATLAAARLALWMGAGAPVSHIMLEGVVGVIKIFFHRA